jgi:O-antigen/teichoic acid export membrane protein
LSPPKETPRHGLALGAVVGLLGEGLVLPVGVVSAAFLTRRLGLTEYGLLGVVFAAVSPVAWVAASVFGGRAAVRLISTAEGPPLETAAAVIRLNFWIGLVGWVGFCAAAPILAQALARPGLAGLLMLAGAEILLFPIARAHRDTLTALGRYSGAGVAAAIQNAARLLMVIALVTAGLRVEGVVLALILARIAEISWSRHLVAPPLRGAQKIRYGRLGTLATTSFLYALCIQVFNRVDILLLTALGGSAATVSEFAAAQGLAIAPGLFAMVVSGMMIAAITRAEAVGADSEARRLRGSCDQLAAVAAGATVALAGAASSLSSVLFGASFQGAAPLLTLLLLGGAGSIVLSLCTAQLIVSNRYRTLLAVGASMLALAVCGHLLSIPVWGGRGAAATTAAVSGLAALAATLSVPGVRSLRLARLAGALACGLAGFGVARLIAALGVPLLDAAGGVAAAGVLMYAVGVVTLADIRGVLSSLRPAKAARVGLQAEERP